MFVCIFSSARQRDSNLICKCILYVYLFAIRIRGCQLDDNGSNSIPELPQFWKFDMPTGRNKYTFLPFGTSNSQNWECLIKTTIVNDYISSCVMTRLDQN